MDVGAILPAHGEPFERVQPGEGALDHPADRAQAGAVGDAAAGDDRPDATLFDQPPVFVVVVAAVGDHAVRPPARPAGLAPHRWDGVQQGQELGDVVAVTAGQRDRERDPVAVDEEMVLAAWPGPVDRAWSDVVGPLFARTCDPSAAARVQSI
jgi:hypothetical protein